MQNRSDSGSRSSSRSGKPIDSRRNLDFTTVFRTRTVGSGIATSFGTIPYNVAAGYPAAGLSEFRMSDQNSRLSLKIELHHRVKRRQWDSLKRICLATMERRCTSPATQRRSGFAAAFVDLTRKISGRYSPDRIGV